MTWDVYEVSLQAIRSLGKIVEQVKVKDKGLAEQLVSAASSVTLNLAEGRRRDGRDRLYRWRIAAGSAQEVKAAVDVAAAWGYVDVDTASVPLGLVDRVLAMLWRMLN